jgi:hypothetical protein
LRSALQAARCSGPPLLKRCSGCGRQQAVEHGWGKYDSPFGTCATRAASLSGMCQPGGSCSTAFCLTCYNQTHSYACSIAITGERWWVLWRAKSGDLNARPVTPSHLQDC